MIRSNKVSIKKLTIMLVAVVMSLVLVDRVTVYFLNAYLLRNDAGIRELFRTADLQFGGPVEYGRKSRKCFFHHALFIYGYQRCFDQRPFPGDSNPGQMGYYFVFSGPRPKTAIFLRGDEPDDYYFTEYAIFGQRLAFIRENGQVERFEE